MATYRLTRLGRIANRHGVLTPTKFWSDLAREAKRLQDQDADWEVLFMERLQGMREMLELFREHGEPRNWPCCERDHNKDGDCDRHPRRMADEEE